MKKLLKKIIIIFSLIILIKNNIYAATVNISANKTTAYVGDNVTISVSINAAAWNLNVAGNGINGGPITGFNMEGVNQTTTKSYNLNTSSTGTYVISLKGDISDGATEVTSDISKSVTITKKEKPVAIAPPTSTNVNNNVNNNITKPSNTTNKPATSTSVNKNNTVVKLSANAYLSQFRIDEPRNYTRI